MLLALPASALTPFTVSAVVDLTTSTYIDAEVLTAQVIIVAAGLLAVLAWTGVIVLHKSARRDHRTGPRRLMVTALVVTLVLAVLGSLGTPGWLPVAAYGLTVAAAMTALVGAARM